MFFVINDNNLFLLFYIDYIINNIFRKPWMQEAAVFP